MALRATAPHCPLDFGRSAVGLLHLALLACDPEHVADFLRRAQLRQNHQDGRCHAHLETKGLGVIIELCTECMNLLHDTGQKCTLTVQLPVPRERTIQCRPAHAQFTHE